MGEPPGQIGLQCQQCGYNLTGLQENRCPECGQAFNPAVLRRFTDPQPYPFNPWDRRGRPLDLLRSFVRVTLAPRRFFKRYPNRHPALAAQGYSLWCYFGAIAVGVLGMLGLDSSWQMAMVTAGAGLGVALTALICETLIAVMLWVVVKPARALNSYHYWRGVTHYTSGFLLFTAGVIAFEFLIVDQTRSYYFGALFAMPIAHFLWWAATLMAVVTRLARPGARTVLGLFLILPIGAASVWLGFFLAYFFGAMCVIPHF